MATTTHLSLPLAIPTVLLVKMPTVLVSSRKRQSIPDRETRERLPSTDSAMSVDTAILLEAT